MKLVSPNVKFIIKVTCLGLYMHHLVFWNKLLSGKSIFVVNATLAATMDSHDEGLFHVYEMTFDSTARQ